MDDIVEGVVRVMQGAPERKNGEDGLPVPPYAVYNIGNQNPENLLDFVQILQEELIRAGVLPEDYDFEAHKKLVPMQPGDVYKRQGIRNCVYYKNVLCYKRYAVA